MKRSYEKYSSVVVITIIFFISFIICFVLVNKSRFRTYLNINAVVISRHYVEAFITDYELKLLKNRNIVYIDNKRIKVKIETVEKNVLKKKKITYHEIILKLNIPKEYKDNDYIEISLYKNKDKVIRIFKSCWKEEK